MRATKFLVFDVVFGVLAAPVAWQSDGWLRAVATISLFLAIAWVPYDLWTESRRE